MRVNLYSQELTDEIEHVKKEGTNREGKTEVFEAVRWFLESSDKLHAQPGDDDRSAVTIWLPRSAGRRRMVAEALYKLGDLITENTEE
jgi:hypothetical protein